MKKIVYHDAMYDQTTSWSLGDTFTPIDGSKKGKVTAIYAAPALLGSDEVEVIIAVDGVPALGIPYRVIQKVYY